MRFAGTIHIACLYLAVQLSHPIPLICASQLTYQCNPTSVWLKMLLAITLPFVEELFTLNSAVPTLKQGREVAFSLYGGQLLCPLAKEERLTAIFISVLVCVVTH
jgi:hypothetical protein